MNEFPEFPSVAQAPASALWISVTSALGIIKQTLQKSSTGD